MEELKEHTKYSGYYEQGHIEYSYTMNMYAVALLYATASYSRPSENRKSGTKPVITRLNQQHLQLDIGIIKQSMVHWMQYQSHSQCHCTQLLIESDPLEAGSWQYNSK